MNHEQQTMKSLDTAESIVPAYSYAGRSTLHASRASALRSTLYALRASSDAPRSTLHALRASGFSLVEVTLALMVMAIGILSIMSLFPAGLDQNARSIADTHAAFFAEEVFGGMQATAETNWAGLADFDVPVSAKAMWDPNTNTVYVSTNVVMNKYEYISGVNTYEDHALRYRLIVTNAVGNGLLKTATLWVWPGEFGNTNDPNMFYAEFFRWKPL